MDNIALLLLITWVVIGISDLIRCLMKGTMTWLGYWCAYAMIIILLLDRCFGG